MKLTTEEKLIIKHALGAYLLHAKDKETTLPGLNGNERKIFGVLNDRFDRELTKWE